VLESSAYVSNLDKSERLFKRLEKSGSLISILSSKLLQFEARGINLNVVATTSQKTNSNTSNKSQGKYQVEITRELNKEFLMYCYSIYTIDTWSMLAINTLTLMSIY